MGISYQGRDIQKQSEVGLRLEDLVSYDYSAYDSGSGEGAVEVVDRWLVADDLQYSSSIEFDKESFETYSASYFLPTVINISGAFYGTFSGSGASISGPLAVIGTSSFYGPVNVSGAIRLDPTEDPGNIEPSSSFLFQSASNTDLGTDLYFRQNGQLIKFNWLVDTLFTSLVYGGVVTYSGNTVYISSGSGIIVDYNANNINESAPSVQYITWPDLSFVPTYINVRQVTYLAIDSGSNVYQNYDPFDTDDYRSKIVLGAVGHFDLANVTAFQGATLTAYDQQNQTNTFIDAFGPLKLTGYELTTQPSSFKLSVAAGTTFIHGGFYDVSPVEPSNIATVAQATASLAYVYRNGAGGVFFDTNGGAFYTNVTCSLYDDGTGSPASVSNNNWTIQRVTIDPRTGKLYIYYGQNIYATLDDALTNLSTDSFTEGDTKYFTTFLGYLVVKSNTTDLANTTDNTILNSGLFRGIGGGGGGTGGGGAGTPGGSSTQIQYNNGGTFDGNANFTFVSSSNTVFVTGSLVVSGSSTFRNIGPTQLTGSTYISSSDATQLQVGSNLLFVSRSGNVGIGTLTPTASLHVSGSTADATHSFLVQNSLGQTLISAQNNRTVSINSTNVADGDTTIGTTSGTITFNRGYNNTLLRNALTFYGGGDISTIQGWSSPTSGIAVGYAQTNINPVTGSVFTIKGTATTSGSGVLFVTGSSATRLLTVASQTISNILTVSGSGVVGIGASSLTYGSTGTTAGKLTISNTSGNNGLAIRNGDGGYQLAIKTTTNDNIGTEFVWYDGATTTFLQYGGALGSRLGSPGNAQFRSNNVDSSATIHTGGSALERLRVTSTGLVGISTSTPSASLHISGSSNSALLEIDSPTTNNILYISGSGTVGIGNTGVLNTALAITANGNGGGNFIIRGYDASAVNRFLVAASGRLQMTGATDTGTSGTDERVRLTNTFSPTSGTREHMGIYLVQAISQSGGANGITRGLYIQPTLTSAADYRAIETTSGSILFNHGASTLFFASSSGNVGIGTANPDSYYAKKLVVSAVDESGITIAGTTTSATNYLAFADGTTGNQAYRGYVAYKHLTDQLAFGTGGTLRATIDNSGNFGIGTSTSTILARMHARGSGTTSATTALRVENTNASASLTVLDNGFVGIGTASPAYLLDITGSDNLINISPQNSGNAIVINNGGYIKWENASLDTYMRCSNGFGLSDNGFNSKFSIAFGGLSSINTGQNFSFQTGNVLVGTTTDSGFKLDVSGSGRFTNGLTVTGSLIAPTITGSLLGTASYATQALSASWAPSVASNPFPFTGSAIISGSLTITGSLQVGVPGANNPAIDSTVGTLSRGAVTSLDWVNRGLIDSSTITSVDWESRALYDTTGVLSADWNSRVLYTPNGATAFEYSTAADDTVTSQLYIGNYTSGQVQRNLSENILYSGHTIQGTIDAGVSPYDIMYLDTDGTWYSLKNLPVVSTKMLGIEVGGNVLIEGDMTVSDDGSAGTYVVSADHGLPVYLSGTTGQLTTVQPSSDVIRVVGHIYYQNPVSTNVWLMKFRPSNDWTQI